MAVEAHVEALRRRHQALEGQLRAIYASPAADAGAIASLKREKLRLKDEIERLQRDRQVPTSGH